METVYRMKRRNLRLMQRHPTWTCRQLAEAVEMSLGWVKKWRRRLKESEPVLCVPSVKRAVTRSGLGE